MTLLAEDFHQRGFALIPQCLPVDVVDAVSGNIEVARGNEAALQAVSNKSGVYAMRNLTDVVPSVVQLLKLPEVVSVIQQILGPHAFMIRSTLFDKTDGANWGVFWHQDLSIAVKQRHEVAGFHAWTRKAGVTSVQPPIDLMRRVLAVRLHLDDCTAANGALKVLPGTHHAGRLCATSLDASIKMNEEVVCEVPAGGAVLMNPLTLHASSPMSTSGHRRVIHFEFANFALPFPLEWQYQIPCCT